MRPHRVDEPGTRWMITNRGIAKRAVFETRQDVERFCELLAEVVELGLLEVRALVFMTTHLHLLLESTTGEISRAMRLVGNGFVRWLHRRLRRLALAALGPSSASRSRRLRSLSSTAAASATVPFLRDASTAA